MKNIASAVLCSPRFCTCATSRQGGQDDATWPRAFVFLWGNIPDELLELQKTKHSIGRVLAAQVDRMLVTNASSDFCDSFPRSGCSWSASSCDAGSHAVPDFWRTPIEPST